MKQMKHENIKAKNLFVQHVLTILTSGLNIIDILIQINIKNANMKQKNHQHVIFVINSSQVELHYGGTKNNVN